MVRAMGTMKDGPKGDSRFEVMKLTNLRTDLSAGQWPSAPSA